MGLVFPEKIPWLENQGAEIDASREKPSVILLDGVVRLAAESDCIVFQKVYMSGNPNEWNACINWIEGVESEMNTLDEWIYGGGL